jgi:DNA-binding NarL/FixJ family response regulator
MNKINVLIAEGRKLLREGIAVLLKSPDIRVVGEADKAAAAMRLIESLAVRVLLLNAATPVSAAADVIHQIVAAHPQVRIIVLSASPSAVGMREVLDAGAAGYLTADCGAPELHAAIRTVVDGKKYVTPHLASAVIDGYINGPAASSARRALARREREILCRIASGQNTKCIAADLGVSAKTIETHRRRVMNKLDRHSIAELTQYAIAEGLIALAT